MRRFFTLFMALCLAFASVGVIGCNDSPADNVEDAAENVGDAVEDVTD